MPKIPFLDLAAPHEELKEELCEVFVAALRTGGFVGGPMVEGFERDFASFCGTQHCVGVASGTDAVRFALMAAGLKKGATVVTVPNTFIATTEAITQAGEFTPTSWISTSALTTSTRRSFGNTWK